MDVNVTWKMLVEAIEANNRELAVYLAGDIRRWVRKGGFPPESVPSRELVILACDAIQEWF